MPASPKYFGIQSIIIRNIARSGILLAAAALLPSPRAEAAPLVFSASGPSAAAIQATVDAFRAQLGQLNPNVAGSLGTGRREINWDGVPNALAAPNPLPGNFFNTTSPRGADLSTPGTGFQVSASAASGTPVEFGNLNPTYSSIFSTFSAERLFAPLGSTITDLAFLVPGTATAAATRGFGAVFTDVDLPAGTSIGFFSPADDLLASVTVPAWAGDGGLSFLGVLFNAGEQVGRVRITSGNAPLGANDGGAIDIVAMDDFIYAEPIAAAVPAPPGVPMLATALGLLAALRRRR